MDDVDAVVIDTPNFYHIKILRHPEHFLNKRILKSTLTLTLTVTVTVTVTVTLNPKVVVDRQGGIQGPKHRRGGMPGSKTDRKVAKGDTGGY